MIFCCCLIRAVSAFRRALVSLGVSDCVADVCPRPVFEERHRATAVALRSRTRSKPKNHDNEWTTVGVRCSGSPSKYSLEASPGRGRRSANVGKSSAAGLGNGIDSVESGLLPCRGGPKFHEEIQESLVIFMGRRRSAATKFAFARLLSRGGPGARAIQAADHSYGARAHPASSNRQPMQPGSSMKNPGYPRRQLQRKSGAQVLLTVVSQCPDGCHRRLDQRRPAWSAGLQPDQAGNGAELAGKEGG